MSAGNCAHGPALCILLCFFVEIEHVVIVIADQCGKIVFFLNILAK